MESERAGTRQTVARMWRGRTRPDVADEYEAHSFEAGIRPRIEKARARRPSARIVGTETEFMSISNRESVEHMAAFTGGDPRSIHHLDGDPE
jgi:hypothetical protein